MTKPRVAPPGPMEQWVEDNACSSCEHALVDNTRLFHFAREQDAIRADLVAALEGFMGSRRLGGSLGELHLSVFDEVLDGARDAIARAKGGAA